MSFGIFTAKSLPPEDNRCPHCDAPIKPGKAEKCWLCLEQLSEQEGTPRLQRLRVAATTTSSDAASEEARAKIILGMAGALVCVGLTLAAPGLLMFFLIVASPFVIHMIIRRTRTPVSQNASGEGTSSKRDEVYREVPRSSFEIFLTWIGGAIVVGLTSFAAFVAAFVAICTGGSTFAMLNDSHADSFCWIVTVVSFVAGVFAAIFVGRTTIRGLRPKRD
jgi:hypothetical protein